MMKNKMNNQKKNKILNLYIINNNNTHIISDLVRNRSIYKIYKTELKEKKVTKRVTTISGGK